ncbi:MAG: cytochrome c peroxidase, partial [Roseibacillus sp.]
AAAAGNLSGPGGVWEQLAQRLQAIPEYVDLFVNAFPDINVATDITFVHAANAIAAFEAAQWRADNSPFDRYLRGERDTMSDEAIAGMNLFYGAAKCADCHSGTFQTDQSFHALAMPQIGPGKGNGPSGHEDFGRYNETGDPDDMFKFRTPSLRNTQLTGPWSHSGAYNSLEAVIRHHLDPIDALNNYDRAHAVLPSRPDLDALDFIVQDDPVLRAAIAAANELDLPHLNDKKVQDLIAFIGALTDPASLDLRIAVPKSVPSGLPIFD